MKWNTPDTLVEMFRLVADRPDTPDWLPDPLVGRTLNIGAGNKHIRGAVTLDLPWDADTEDIPYPDDHFIVIYAIHFLEHVRYPRKMLRELQRVLEPGGHLNIGLPYATSVGGLQDLDHKSFWTEETWKNTFNNTYYDKDHEGWKFRVGANFIIGIVERNTMLVTQLIKE
jgi:SAM-dependent methyltransferase